MDKETAEVYKTLISSGTTFIVAIITGFIATYNAIVTTRRHKKYENRILAYSKINALNVSIIGAVHRYHYKKFDTFYHDNMHVLTKEKYHFDTLNKYYDSLEHNMKEVADETKELLETIGLIKTCFVLTCKKRLMITWL